VNFFGRRDDDDVHYLNFAPPPSYGCGILSLSCAVVIGPAGGRRIGTWKRLPCLATDEDERDGSVSISGRVDLGVRDTRSEMMLFVGP